VAAFAPGAPYGQIGAQSVLKRLRRAEAESSTGRERTGPSPPANQEWPRPCLRPRVLDHHTVPPPSRGRGPQFEAASDLFDLAPVGSRVGRPAERLGRFPRLRPRSGYVETPGGA